MSGSDRPRADATRVVTAGRRPEWTGGIVSAPVWRASTILYDSVAELRASAGRDTHHRLFYGRRGTPTQWSLADALTELEPGAEGTFLYPSGVAAIAAALLSVLSPGDELLCVDSAYDPTRSLATGLLKRFGIATRFYDPMIGAGIADLIGENTRAILMESPGSLTFEVQDVPAIVAAARARGVATLLDNTWATPLHFRAIGHGVDLSILACTKYVVGHSDVMLGSVTAAPGRWRALRETSFQLGQVTSPDDAWLGSRGLRTMAIRLERHAASALAIARWLADRPEVARVLHPALPSCPGHDLFARDFTGASGLFAFVLAGGDEAARAALIDTLELFGIGYSWGGFESLAIPVDPQRYRTATTPDFAGPLIRLQIGLEDPGDLIADLERGLAAFRAARGVNAIAQFLAAQGILLPGRDDAIETAIAGGIIALALAAGVLAGRSLGPRVASLWKSYVAHHGEGVWTRMGAIVRHGVAALLLAIALAAWPWVPLAALALGFTLGCAVALAAHQVLRGLGIPRWMTWLVAGVLFVALLSHAVGGLAPITDALERVGFSIGRRRFSLLSLITMLVTATTLIALVRLANRVIGHAIGSAKSLDPTQRLLGQKLAGIAIVVVAFFLGLDLLDIDLTAFTLFSGGLGLAVGFGLQKTVGNLIAGIILLLDRSIKPGDVIVVGETFGSVEKIGVRAVSVVTRDGKEHLIPNENLMTERVENWSFTDRNVRVRIPVGVGYDCDLKLAQALMLQAARESPRVLDSPKPNVWLTDYGNDAVQHEILAWISDPESGVGNVRSDVLNRLWLLFKDNGITIPFAQRDLYLRGVSPDAAAALGVAFRQQSDADR